MTLKRSLKVIQTSSIRKLECGCLFALPSSLVWKTRMVGHGEKNFETEYRRVTDGRTPTDGHLATALSALCIVHTVKTLGKSNVKTLAV